MDGNTDAAVAAVNESDERRNLRLGALAWVLALGSVLLVSRLLTPDPRGFGTHEHLYLPPCFFHSITHLPCPFCGMTTGFSWMSRGAVSAALHANPGAPLGYVLTWIGFVLSLRAVAVPSPVLPAWASGKVATRIVIAVTLALWAAHIVMVLLGYSS